MKKSVQFQTDYTHFRIIPGISGEIYKEFLTGNPITGIHLCLRFFTGFTEAALIACMFTVSTEMRSAHPLDSTKIYQLISIR
ncbi:hypothetical protein ACFL6I_04730 [candidate division KSB1 bacterium]